MENTIPGTAGSSLTLPGIANGDIFVLRGYHEQFIQLERQKKRMLNIQPSHVRAAHAAANNVRFERDTIRDGLLQNPKDKPIGLRWWPPGLRLERSDLCTPCRAIDFEAAFTTPRAYPLPHQQWIHYHEQDTQSFHHIERNTKGVNWPVNSNCQFCLYLANAVHTSPERGEYTLVFHNDSQSHHDEVLIQVFPFSFQEAYWFLPKSPGFTSPSHPNQFEATFGHHYSFDKMRSASNTIICHRNRPIRKAGTPQIVSPVLDASLAKSWFDICAHKHRACRLEPNVQVRKIRLIDCDTRRLISADSLCDPTTSFVALSYVWGTGLNGTPKTLTEDLSMDLPLTIEDAITVTKALNFHYLWVDQYCIDQGDEKDKQEQIQQMDRIYKCAALTIIAAAGNSCEYGLPGVSACHRDVLDPFVLDDVFTFGMHPQEDRQYWRQGRWHTRGWTFQEALLSRRRLVFSDTAMYYECMGYTKGAWQSELRGGVECADSDDSRSPYDRNRVDGAGVQSVVGSNTLSNPVELDGYNFEWLRHKGLVESFLTYIRLVTQYTTRTLSHDSDALDAFRGAANALQRFDHPVYSISGIPFVVPGLAEVEDSLFENSFLCGLTWLSTAGAMTPSPAFPSWSWANMRVWNVTWTSDNQAHEPILTDAIYHAHDMRIEFNGNKELCPFTEFAKACRNPTPLSQFEGSPTALCFKSRILCSRFTSECLDDDEESFLGNVYSDLGHGIFDVTVHLDVVSPDEHSDDSGGARHVHDSQPRCLIEMREGDLLEDLVSERCSLVLLRFDSEEASVLLVEWLGGEPDGHQRTARRVGILKVGTFYRHEEVRADRNNRFLRCFSIETDLRLI